MTTIERMAKAAWIRVQEQVPAGNRLTDWSLVPDDAKKNFTDFARAALLGARGIPSANAVLAAARATGMRPSQIDLAVTHWIDAVLGEKE